MKQTNKLQKLFSLLLAVAITVMAYTALNVASAQTTNPKCEETALGAAFGCSGLLTNGTIDPSSIITLVFRIILYAAVLWTVWNVVLAGIKIAGAKEDADKRKEGIQAVINAVIGLVVALLAFGIVTTVTRQIGGGDVEISTSICTAKDIATKATFTGFYVKGSDKICVLKDGSGKILRSGCVGATDDNLNNCQAPSVGSPAQ
mgnify:CR=1 FL=1